MDLLLRVMTVAQILLRGVSLQVDCVGWMGSTIEMVSRYVLSAMIRENLFSCFCLVSTGIICFARNFCSISLSLYYACKLKGSPRMRGVVIT
jgi:hypothetical protein